MYELCNNIFGTYSGNFGFASGELYIGVLNEDIHVEVSYSSIGIMHEKAKIKNITDSYVDLILDLNHEAHDMHLEYHDNSLVGIIEIAKVKLNVEFSKIKNTFEFCETYSLIPEQHIKRLKENHTYIEGEASINLNYELNNSAVLKYLDEIGIKVENNHDFSTVQALLKEFCAKIHHDDSNYTHNHNYGTINQLKFALKQNSFTNCRGAAIIFSGILRAYGFKSSYITCVPYDSKDLECHVVCEVYIDEFEKFIFIDPSNQVYFIKDGVILNLLELRKCIENNEAIAFYQEASHNDEPFDLVSYLGYFAKNIFYFVKCIDNCEDKESIGENALCFVPVEYAPMVKDKYNYVSSNINDYYQH